MFPPPGGGPGSLSQVGPPKNGPFMPEDNKKCALFCSKQPTQHSQAQDAFTLYWGQHLHYAFRPLPLIHKTLQKIRQDAATLIFITPYWQRQVWFPFLQRLQPEDQGHILHPKLDTLVLIAWMLKGEPLLPLCTPGLLIPNPSGFYYDDKWTSRVCSTKKFPTPPNVTKCLRGKVVYMFGDSTLRQWWLYLDEFVPSLKRIDLHVPPLIGPLLAIDPENNYLVQWRVHGRPLRTYGKPLVADVHYMANDIDGIGGGPQMVIVFTIWAHFTHLPVDMYIRRVQIIRRAVVDLLQRSPQTTVIIKSANTGFKGLDFNEWQSLQLDIILRRMFSGIQVAIIDTWQMTSCHYLPEDIHPARIIIQNEIDILLSLICPR
uniref:NXPE family member 3-like n=1 Tax=Geotrypetes seraphini TaxID=260995 RepID=A0A6P8PDP9_GEOSA|nr:NXPE family member 3-like [Geotrypetes seraphini]